MHAKCNMHHASCLHPSITLVTYMHQFMGYIAFGLFSFVVTNQKQSHQQIAIKLNDSAANQNQT